MTTQLRHTMRELDSRANDGLEVRLLSDPDDGRVAVAVVDSKTDDEFGFEVEDRDRAREAFQHPSSYAAWREIETGTSAVEALGGLAA
jgi:hypothetical protein